ncbi:MAG TPA: efflux RND transporter periplasmic adaptor subunit [Nitrospirota bacterium]|nr:efflux RND transporter periplasmic adaptor subunit [Nitrospirota bacterium]
MKKVMQVAIIVLLVAASFLVGSWYQKNHMKGTGSPAGRTVLYYIDPMNPAVKSDKPGIAPCGMPLEPVYADGTGGTSGLPAGTVNISTQQQQLIGVATEIVEKSARSHTFRLLGRVIPDESRVYKINAVTDGWIKKISPITSGAMVKRDDLLATFYSPEFFPAIKAYLFGLKSLARFQANEKETDEQLKLTEANIDNYRVGLRNLGMSEHQIDEIGRTHKGADNIEIRAPGGGIIIARNIYLGQRMERGSELFRIADLSRVWVLADVYENEGAYFRPGNSARVVLANQNKIFKARVSDVLPQFDAISRTLKLRLEVDNPDLVLRPDMFVDVELPVTFPRAITVPVDAVRYSGLRKTVYIDRGNGLFEPRAVETGWQFGNRVEIVRGLTAGERIVVSGNFLIDSESRMKAAAAGIFSTAQKDPVCNMDVDEDQAKRSGRTSEYHGNNYYFCSEGCKQKFDKDPGQYVKKSAEQATQPAAAVQQQEGGPGSAIQKDPVCGMLVHRDEARAAGRSSEYQGRTYYFCSDMCKHSFDQNAAAIAKREKEVHSMQKAGARETRR